MSDNPPIEGQTFWFVPGERCPKCDGPVATDGLDTWCVTDGCIWKGR